MQIAYGAGESLHLLKQIMRVAVTVGSAYLTISRLTARTKTFWPSVRSASVRAAAVIHHFVDEAIETFDEIEVGIVDVLHKSSVITMNL